MRLSSVVSSTVSTAVFIAIRSAYEHDLLLSKIV
jgi:hypothetical protein